MELNEFYLAVGGNCEDVLSRLPGEALVRRFVRKFPEDPSYAQLKTALAGQALPEAFRAAHTLKGTAATLGLGALATAASVLTEALRNASAEPEMELVQAVDAAYQTTLEQIARLD